MANACPPPEKLEQLLLGKLSNRESRQLEQHLLECRECCDRVEQLSASDHLVAALRKAKHQVDVSPVLQKVIQRAKQMPPRKGTASPHRDDSPLPSQDASRFPEEFNLLAPPQQPGEVGRLDGYRVLGVIGSGGMGVVFLAEDLRLRRSVALKVMKPSLARNQQAKERFLREAQAMAAVEHECIVPIYQVGEEGGVPFIAMPLLRGQTLQEYLRNKKALPPLEAVRIARQVAAGLAAAHKQGLIHRDIKPANIWLEKNGRVRLLDFGLARPMGQDSDLTHTGAVVGTPNYMAPEQARGDKLDFRCDLFSLGAVLYHMLSGRRPFSGKTLAMVLAAVMQQEPPPLDQLVPGLPPELARLVHRLLAKYPNQRPQSAAEVYRELVALEKRLQASPKSQAVPAPPPPPGQPAPAQSPPSASPPAPPGPFPQPPLHPRRKPLSRRIDPLTWFLFLAGGMAALVLLAMMAVFFLRTDKGVIRVEINDPQVEVQLKGTNITLRGVQGGKDIQVEPGSHALVVRRGDFQFETNRLILRRGQRVTVRVDYIQGQVVVRQGTRELARAQVPEGSGETSLPKTERKSPAAPKPQPEPQPGPSDTKPPQAGSKPDAAQPPPAPNNPSAPSQSDASDKSDKPSPAAANSQPPVAVAPFGPKVARAYQEAWAKYLGVPVEKEVDLGGGVKMQFVLIPPGEFSMGLSEHEAESLARVASGYYSAAVRLERPLHKVQLTAPFYLAKFETTRAQFARFVQETQYVTQAERQGSARVMTEKNGKPNPIQIPGITWNNNCRLPGFTATPEHPANAVNKDDAEAFCKWLAGKIGQPVQLPSEAQWEFACRAGTTMLTYFNNDGKELFKWANGHSTQDGFPFLAPVGRFPPNPFGLHDMLGNVSEVCRDTGRHSYGSASLVVDPVHVGNTPWWAYRGGTWELDIHALRPARRWIPRKGEVWRIMGFRVALPLQTPPAVFHHPAKPAPGCGIIYVDFNGNPYQVVVEGTGVLLDPRHPANTVVLAAGKHTLEIWQNGKLIEKHPVVFQAGQILSLRLQRRNGRILVQTLPGLSPALSTALLVTHEPVEQLGHSDGINAVAFSPDGRFVLTGSGDHTAILWNAQTGVQLRTFKGHLALVCSVAFSPDGRLVLTGSRDHTAILWDAQMGTRLRTFKGHSSWVRSVAFSPDGRFVLTGSHDKTVILWDARTGKQVRTFRGHAGSVVSVAFSPDGRFVLTGSDDKTAILWNVQTGRRLRTFRGHSHWVFSVAFSPNGRLVLTGSQDKTAILWDAQTGAQLRTFKRHLAGVHSVAFSPDGRFVLTGSLDKTAILWDARTGRQIRTFRGHSSEIRRAVFSPDGRFVLTGSLDHRAILWEARTGRRVRTFKSHAFEVHAVAFSPDGRWVLTGSDNSRAALWDTQTGQQLRTFKGHSSWVRSVAFSPDGRFVLTGSQDKTAILWDAQTGQRLRTFEGHSGGVTSVAFSPDGRFVLTSSGDGTAILWSAQTGRRIRTFNGHSHWVLSVAFSPDGRFVLTGSQDKTAILWDTQTGQPIHTFKGHSAGVASVCFSPDGRFVLTGSGDYTAALWNTQTGRQIRTFKAHLGLVRAVFSSDGRFVLTGSWDHTAILWDAQTGEQIRTFRGHAGPIDGVAFSPNGRLVATGSEDGSARVWDVETGRELLRWWHLENGRWLAVTPQGYFTGSQDALHLVRHRDIKTGRLIPPEESQRYYRPDKVAEVLERK